MSDYLNNLLARSRNLAPVVQPRLASLFEPATPNSGAANRPLFEATSSGEAHAESESSPQLSPSLPAQTAQPSPQHLQTTIVVPHAPPQQRQREGGERYESREDSSRHSLQPLSTVTPPAPLLTAPPARTAPDVQRETIEILRPLPSSTQLPARRNEAGERNETRRAGEADGQQNWEGLEPKVRQVVSEELTSFRRTQTRAADGAEAGTQQQAQASQTPVVAQRQDNGTKKSAQAFPVETAETSPTINVSIGRVDVRAIISPQPAAPAERPPAQKRGTLSLDEYLKQRSGGRR
jgi:hypothetical protein